VEKLADRVAGLGQNLAHLDPRRVLERGYAIVEGPDGAIVQDARELAPGNGVALTFARGRATGTITGVEPDEPAR
jgi:exodeoxyribonuclease VII large subunit